MSERKMTPPFPPSPAPLVPKTTPCPRDMGQITGPGSWGLFHQTTDECAPVISAQVLMVDCQKKMPKKQQSTINTRAELPGAHSSVV